MLALGLALVSSLDKESYDGDGSGEIQVPDSIQYKCFYKYVLA